MIDNARIDEQIENFISDTVHIEEIDEDFLVECLVELKHHRKFITPKKVESDENGYLVCANCKIQRVSYLLRKSTNYCSFCGQCLDWSEVE